MPEAILFLGEINTGTWPFTLMEFQILELKIWPLVLRDSNQRKISLARPNND
jgi:hypothetical protein